MVCQLPTVRYSPRYRIHWIYEFICACNLIMRDSWIDEVHMSASWLCSLFLSHLLSLGSSDRSHNAITTIKLTTSISSSSPWPGCSPISPDILPPPVIYSCNFLGIAAVVLHWSVYMLVHRCWCVFPKRPLLLTFPRRANPLARRSPAAICVSPPPPISPPLSLYARPLHSHRTL